ncbi:hypothetical protein RR46_08618 [Papilio xuthus]|uniref:Uncharacterized protein n=1 Tax=Papilio xuthus TaxID=66420 RepID=A0A194QDQ0_PAPXU|nr:hypothetical protein RR46_08618 [Papilio xuthus]
MFTDKNPVKQTDGIEFSNISRSTLLQILSAIEEETRSNPPAAKQTPVFTAQFANNKYTRPFIYPFIHTRDLYMG